MRYCQGNNRVSPRKYGHQQQGSVPGEGAPSAATNYRRMALDYALQGDYDKSRVFEGKSLVARQEELDEDDPRMVKVCRDLGNLRLRGDDYDGALEYYAKGLALAIGLNGERHPDVATIYSEMAAVFTSQGA